MALGMCGSCGEPMIVTQQKCDECGWAPVDEKEMKKMIEKRFEVEHLPVC